MSNGYEIIVREDAGIKGYVWGSRLTFLTKARNVKSALRRYINEQEGKDVFEYSVFGSPNQKIGNFTGQQKLERWSA